MEGEIKRPPPRPKVLGNTCLCAQAPKPMSTTGRTVGPNGGPRKMEVIEKHLKFILNGVNSIGLKGDVAVGYFSAFGSTAFPILASYMEDSDLPSTRHPIAVAGEIGDGKIIAFAHNSFLHPISTTTTTTTKAKTAIGGLNESKDRDLNRLIANCCKWVVRKKPVGQSQGQGQTESQPVRLCELVNQPQYLCPKGREKKARIQNPSILILSSSNTPNPHIVPLLKSYGMRAELKILEPGTGKQAICCGDIKSYDVVCTATAEGFDEDRVKLFTEYVENGGGLIIAFSPWAHIYEYKEQIKGNFALNYPPNELARLAGFVWCDLAPFGHAKAWKQEKDCQIFCAHQNLLRNTHVLDLWYEMKHYDIFGKFPPNFPPSIKRQLVAVFNSARRYVHPKDQFWTNEFFRSASRYLKSEDAKTAEVNDNKKLSNGNGSSNAGQNGNKNYCSS